eukprot:scaffold8888_cov161-Amphora_coffeaeformis.AAC.5
MALQASAFAPSISTKTTTTKLEMAVDRRTVLATGAAALMTGAMPAFALDKIPKDNEFVKEQRQVPNKLDVNNSPVGDYMKYPGLYPTIGGKIANNGPYKSVDEAFNLKLLTSSEKSALMKYKSEFVATPPTGLDPLRGRDPYRTSFNDFKEVKTDVLGS